MNTSWAYRRLAIFTAGRPLPGLSVVGKDWLTTGPWLVDERGRGGRAGGREASEEAGHGPEGAGR